MELVSDAGSGRVEVPLRRLGRYELIAKIAAGGMAEVYLARLRGPMNFQKTVVVKVVHPHLATQEEFLRMLLDEARLSALVKHPRVVDIYELGEANGVYFIAMEYLDGYPLGAIMTAGLGGKRLDALSTGRIIADAADGLHAAHELRGSSGPLGLVHRDVSPGNIMVLHDGSVKIVDFGIAKAKGRLTVSGVQQFKGKLGYVAPEQIAGGEVDHRVDVFSLGVVMWEALALRRLYELNDERNALREMLDKELPSPSSIQPDVPEELSQVCLKALRSLPDHRFQTAGAMRDAIQEVLRKHGYYREEGAIKRYMGEVFAQQHETRQRRIRRLVSLSGSLPLPAPPVMPLNPAAPVGDEYDIEISDTEPVEEAAASLAQGTPVEPQSSSAEPRRSGRIVLVLLLLAGLAVAGVLYGPDLLTRFQSPEASPAAVKSKAKSKASRAAAAEPGDQRPDEPSPAEEAEESPASDESDESEVSAAEGDKPAPGANRKPTSKHLRDGKERKPRKEAGKADPPAKPQSVAELYQEGTQLFIQGKHAQAKDRFKQALVADRRHAESHRGLGLVYAAQHKAQKAIGSFEQYLRLRPGARDADSIRKRIEQLKK
jgi:serine/threonine-protein kinase